MSTSQRDKDIELTRIIREARDSFMMRVELFDIIAQDSKAKYDAYLSAGFSEANALFLCKP